jgi:phage recombination protein Bet
VLCDAIFPGAKTAEAIALAVDYCRARRLDPFKRPVHIVPMYSRAAGGMVETVWPGINELEVTAARSGEWAGMDEPKWGPDVTRTFSGMIDNRSVSMEITYPSWCIVTVYRMVKAERYAFAEPVYWDEAYARIGRTELPNDTWQRRVRGQLHKCAKAASLRTTFPEEVGNDYAAEEMEGKETEQFGPIIEGHVAKPAPPEIEPQPEPDPVPEPEHKRKTFGDLMAEIEAAAKACTTEDDVVALSELPASRTIYTRGKDGVRQQLGALLTATMDRVRADQLADVRDPPLDEAE